MVSLELEYATRIMNRHYPGFLAAFFIILLRIAIGWHFLYEGCEKVEGTLTGKEPFSAEMYVRSATGPFVSSFRAMLPDVDSKAMLDPAQLKAKWQDDVSVIAGHYGFDQEQRDKAQKSLEESLQWADFWFADPVNVEKIKKYDHDLGQILANENNRDALSYETERAVDARRSVEADRRALIAPLIARQNALREAVAKFALPDQAKAAGATREMVLGWLDRVGLGAGSSGHSQATDPVPVRWTSLDVINTVTMFGLIAIGFCLIAGFLTPFAALSAAAFLTMIYLSMPPWPGLPANPKAEGHYLFVSKNLIELIACLVIAVTPSGHWIGLDALFFGAARRRRLARAEQRHEQAVVRSQ
jgi:uncharacterized membrane protein YphA (DoxX/SURF4 family)